MKTIFWVYCTILTCFLAFFLHQENKTLDSESFPLELVAHAGGTSWSVIDTTLLYHVTVSIKNTSEDTVRFHMMSCSYVKSNFALLGESDYSFEYNLCFVNVPRIVELPPDTQTDRHIRLKKRKSCEESPCGSRFRICMRLFEVGDPEAEKEFQFYASDGFKTRDIDPYVEPIIFSNEINMDDHLSQNVYPIE